MGSGISVFLLAVGAILYYAVTATVSGVDISTVGVILMIVGGLGLVLSVAMTVTNSTRAGRTTVVQGSAPAQGATTVIHEDRS